MLNLDSRGTDMVGLDINYNWFTRSMTFEDLFFNYRPTNILWRTMYNQIYTANGVVSTIDPATEDSSLKYYLAQACLYVHSIISYWPRCISILIKGMKASLAFL